MRTLKPLLAWALLFAAGAGLILLAHARLDDYVLSIINFVGIYVILAVSLNITNGFAGLFSLGHPGFMAIGGYVTAILTLPGGAQGDVPGPARLACDHRTAVSTGPSGRRARARR